MLNIQKVQTGNLVKVTPRKRGGRSHRGKVVKTTLDFGGYITAQIKTQKLGIVTIEETGSPYFIEQILE